MNSITIVLRSGMGMQIDSVRPYLRNGMPIAIGARRCGYLALC